jgi:cobalt-zinc-cadmium efflux system membrane fusion protein
MSSRIMLCAWYMADIMGRTAMLSIVLLLAGCGDRGTELPQPPPEVEQKRNTTAPQLLELPSAVRQLVRTEPVTRRSIPERVTAPGEVALDLKQVAKITSRIDGQADRIHAQLGDRVKAGQPLVTIRSLQFDLLIEEYLVGKAQADVAENMFRRTEKLRAQEVVPERKLVEDKGRYLETQARYQHIRGKLLNMGLSSKELLALEQQHDENHRYTVASPIAGTIVAQHVVRGQGVAPGVDLFEVVDTSRVWVFANLPIEHARKLNDGEQGTITPKGGEALTAPLTYVAPIADETTRTIQVRFEVANPQQQLKPHEYVDVMLTRPGTSVLAIPESAITTIDKIRGVFVEHGAAYSFVPVDVGREAGGWIEIKNGVTAGDRVVIGGVFDLKNVFLKEHISSGEGG